MSFKNAVIATLQVWGLYRPPPPEKTVIRLSNFEKHNNLLGRVVQTSKRYAEFGVGKSTVFAARKGVPRIRAVDTSAQWIRAVQAAIPGVDAELVHIDLGATGDWGRPLSYEKERALPLYFETPFHNEFDPDVVFIDGRFRVACWASTMLLASAGATVIFDDYPSRARYHKVEELHKPDAVVHNQALFVVPKERETEALQQMVRDFRYVTD